MSVVYPLWCMVCRDCGFVGTLWEKPGTSCSYVNHCTSCGKTRVQSVRVEDKEEHERIMEGNDLDKLF